MIDALNRALELVPEDTGLHFERGNLLAQTGKWQAALDDYLKGLAHDSRDAICWMAAAALYLELGDVDVELIEGELDLQQFLASVASGEPPSLLYADRDQIGSLAARGAGSSIPLAPSPVDSGSGSASSGAALPGRVGCAA